MNKLFLILFVGVSVLLSSSTKEVYDEKYQISKTKSLNTISKNKDKKTMKCGAKKYGTMKETKRSVAKCGTVAIPTH